MVGGVTSEEGDGFSGQRDEDGIPAFPEIFRALGRMTTTWRGVFLGCLGKAMALYEYDVTKYHLSDYMRR